MAKLLQKYEVFTLNVGNTNTRLFGWHHPATHKEILSWKTRDATPHALEKKLKANAAGNAEIVIAGVVPDIKEGLVIRLENSQFPVRIFRENLKPEIQIVPKPAKNVGDDRIAGAMGASFLSHKHPCVTVDLGTAMTINAISKRNGVPRFEGGLIIPGLAMCLNAMAEHTALLPHLSLKEIPQQPRYIGRDTKSAMLFGVLHAQTKAAIELAKEQMKILGPDCRVVLTGGGADPFIVCEFMDVFRRGMYCPFLIHLGLYATWRASWRQKRK